MMRLKLGTQDFDLDPMLGGKKLADLYSYIGGRAMSWTTFYTYNCRTDTASDADGKIRLELQASVYFSVLKKGKTGRVLDKSASKKNRDALVAKAGTTTKDLVGQIIKAIGPIVINADVNPALSRWRKRYSFEVSVMVVNTNYLLRLTGAHDAGYAIVSIPTEHVIVPRKTGSCLAPHQYSDGLIKWSDPMIVGRIAKEALEEFQKRMDEEAEEEAERMKKKAAKKGIKVSPADEKEK